MKCIVCGRSLSNTETEIHHISYPVNGFPEITVEVHKRCHNIIHNTDAYPGLKPRKGHSAQYYSQKESTEKGSPIKRALEKPAVPKKENYSKVLDIIEENQENGVIGVPYREIVESAAEEGIEENFVKKVLKKEMKRGGIYEPKQGSYAITPFSKK